MADEDLNSHLPQITTTVDAEYQAWADALGTSAERVRDAVERVGHSADAVRAFLQAPHR